MDKLGYIYNYSDTYVVESMHITSSILSSMKHVSKYLELCGIFINLASEIQPFIKIDEFSKSEINTITEQKPYRITASITIKHILKKDGTPNRNIKLNKRVISIFVNCVIVHSHTISVTP